MSNAKFTVNFHYPPLFLPDEPIQQEHIQAQATAEWLAEIIGTEQERLSRVIDAEHSHVARTLDEGARS